MLPLSAAALPYLQSYDSYSLNECTLLVFAVEVLSLLLLCRSAALPPVTRLL